MSVTYSIGQIRQTVKFQTGGFTTCAYQELRTHTNEAEFWANAIIIGSTGLNIGYNPTGKSIRLGKASPSSRDQTYLDGRCRNEFGWGGVDPGSSGESNWWDIAVNLF